MELSTCPGWGQTAALSVRPPTVNSAIGATARPCSPPPVDWIRGTSPSRSAVFGLTMIALSQVSLVIGLGNSWSQALLANRPSKIVGSGRKLSSRPAAGALYAGMLAAFGWPLTRARAVFGITPSRSADCQPDSKLPVLPPLAGQIRRQ